MALTKVTGDFIKAGSITQGHLHSSHGITTTHITEGDKLFFTNARVDSRVGSLSTSNLSEGTNLYYTDARVDARIAAADTGDLSEGSNLYFTNARADARIAAASTSDLSEGTNLYYTDARADARVALIVDSAPGTLNTLNELAAALGDDANFSTTVTNSIALKAPLASPSFTGNATFAGGISVSSPGSSFYTTFKSANDYVIGLKDSANTAQWWLKAYTNGSFALHEDSVGDKFTIAAGGNATFAGTIAASGGNSTQWNTAYGWGDHASGGYLTSFDITTQTDGKYLRSNTADEATHRIVFSGCDTNNHDTIATSTGSQGSVEIYNNGSGNDAFMSFHTGGDFALYFGLDADSNKLAVGGWSMGAAKYAIYHEGNKPTLSELGAAASSHTHDDRYYTEAEMQTFFNRGYINNHSATNAAAGWYTIATNTGDRALGEFQIWDTASSDHQSVLFSASHHFGMDTSNDITVTANSRYSGTNFRYIRIKEGGTYDGAALQVYIDGSSNTVYAAIVGGNAQESGWVLKDWVPDATDPGDLDSYSSMTERTIVDLDQVINGGMIATGPIYSGGQTAQYRNLTTADQITNNNQLTNGAGYTTYTANQALNTSSSPTFNDLYLNSWFRNNNSGQGLYNQATGNHWYSDGGYWNVGYSGTTGIRLRNGHAGTIMGYLYGETSGEFGLLDKDGHWTFRTNGTTETELRANNIIGLKVNSSGNTHVLGNLTIGNTTSSDLYFTDTDETTRRIHCNSNRLGFLNSSNSWSAYSSNNGDWTTDFISYAGQSMRAPIFYDTGNTGYYVDPDSTSRLLNLDFGASGYYLKAGDWGTRQQTPYGWIQLGPANTSHAHIYTDRSNFYFNAMIQVLGGSQMNQNDIRAGVFYDINNTTYYTDPHSTSNVNAMNFAGVADFNGGHGGINITNTSIVSSAASTWTGNPGGDGKIQYHSNRWYIVADSSSNRIVQFRRDGSDKSYIDNDGRLTNAPDLRVPIYYDTNTAYYGDFASHSHFNTMSSAGGLLFGSDYGVGITGLYSASRIQTIFNMGAAYKINNSGTSVTGAYGLYWSHQNAGTLGGANNLASHGILIIENGGFKGSWGGGRLVTPADIRGTIFYDYNNTAYYCDPHSTSNFAGLAVSGVISGSITRTAGTSGYGHAGTGMWPFYNWGGSNGGASAPTSSSYTTGISIGSHPGDQAYGWQMANNMWNTGVWYRTYNSGFSSWYKFLDNTTNTQTINASAYVNGSLGVGFNSGAIGGRVNIQLNANNEIGVKNNLNGRSGITGLLQYTSASYASSGYNMVFQAAPPSGSDVNMLLCYINGNLVNRFNSYGQYSDIKLKENIVDTTPKLEDVKRIRIRNFNFKGDPYKQIGVVAQEFEEVFPGLVEDKEVPDEEGTTKTVKYSVLVPILVKAMQEQQVIIDDLKSRLETLENQ